MSSTKRKIPVWLLVILILVVAAAAGFWLWRQKNDTPRDPRLASLEKLVAASSVKPDFYFEKGFPRWFIGLVTAQGADSVERARNFLETYRDLYWQSDPDLELHVQKTMGAGEEFVYFYQTYKGIQVYGGQILIIVDGNEVVSTIGPLLPAGLIIDTDPVIEAPEAEDLERADMDAPDSILVGSTTAFIYDPALLGEGSRDPRLVWRVVLQSCDTWNVLVDSRTGEILLKNVLTWQEYSLDLEDANYNSAENSNCYWQTTDDDWIGDEDGILEEYLGDGEATNIWGHARKTYDFFYNTFNVDGYDFLGSVVEVYVHADVPNAQWDGGSGCDLIEFSDGWVSYDVLVHEYTHGVIRHTSNLGGSGQAGSLAECFGDTMGMLADPNDWNLGEDRTSGEGANRHYDGFLRWHMDQYDASLTKYDNMGIPCTAGYKLSEGGTHNAWPNSGVGRNDMVRLFFDVMIHIPNGDGVTFMDARNLAVAYAVIGNWSDLNICAVKNAFAAVGLGEGDYECDGIPDPDLTDSDGDWHLDAEDNCPQEYNPFQEDLDHDGGGDACDNDDDGDNEYDGTDNCPGLANPGQEDTDGDGIGDACDDQDNDGIPDHRDNCPRQANTNQNDKDQDGTGDACDADLDGDGVVDWARGGVQFDNCLYISNPDQADADGDGIGDACDACPDTPDAVAASTYPTGPMLDIGAFPQPYQPDSDGDGTPDACDDNIRADSQPWWEGLLDRIKEKRTNVKIQLEPGEAQRVPLPVCPFDRSGWYSQGLRQKLFLVDQGMFPGVWITDDSGGMVAKPMFQDGALFLEYQPRSDRRFFLNFILPAGEEPTEYNLVLSLSCSQKDEEQDALSQASPTATFTSTPTLMLTLTPTYTLTPTATHRPWPTLTFTPTITPYIPVNCAQYTTKEACVAAGCTWSKPAGSLGFCK